MQTRSRIDKIIPTTRFLIFQSLFLGFFVVFSQGKLYFPVTNYDFGTLAEEAGPVEYEFKFVNDGDAPVKVVYVKASCGCTTPGWTKEEVMPGDSGFVKARYNPLNRPGRFRKSLRITTSESGSNQTLYINGMVQPKPQSLEEKFLVSFGDLSLQTKSINLGKVSTEKSVVKDFQVFNRSDVGIKLQPEDFLAPKYIQLELVEDSLAPKEVGVLRLTYNPKIKNDFGYVSDFVGIKADSSAGLSVMAVIEEYFPPMSADELDQAPSLQISERVYDFGSVNQGTPVEKEFELTNVGNEKLEFRAIKSNCDCVTYETKNRGLKKGKSQILKVLFDTSDLRGNQYKSISLFSNDPVNPTQIISIRGSVKKVD